MFSRTESGLANEHLFYRVDFVVYCEGPDLGDDESSLDENFWEKVFIHNGVSSRCKGFGGKCDLLKLGAKIIDHRIPNVVVAMDRDYDAFLGKEIDHPQVMYTYGYSWESDIISGINIEVAVAPFASVRKIREIEEEYESYVLSQSVKLRRLVALDIKYFDHGVKLYERAKPMSIVTFGQSEPMIDFGRIIKKAAKIGSCRRVKIKTDRYREIDGLQSFFGKSIARLVYRWIVYRTRNFQNRQNVSYDAFMRVLLSAADFASTCLGSRCDARNDHYRESLARLSH